MYGLTLAIHEGLHLDAGPPSKLNPVASMGSFSGTVHHRPASRLIWQKVNTGESIYPGESIRTSKTGQARIDFVGSDRFLELDPDTLVVINSTENEIALDLMDGSLMVNGSKDPAASNAVLTLNSAKGKMDLSKSVASLSKSTSGVDLVVHKGTATAADGQTVENQERGISILRPLSDSPTILSGDNNDPISFAWKAQRASPDIAHYQLWIGDSSKKLAKVAETNSGSIYQIDRKVPIGRHFFQLIAVDNSGKLLAESHLQRFEILVRKPPSLISPVDGAELVRAEPTSAIQFSWTKPKENDEILLLVAKDPKMESLVSQQAVTGQSGTGNLPAGTYFWRLSVKSQGLARPLQSKISRFSITNKAKELGLIKWRANLEHQTFVQKPEIHLSWVSDHPEMIHHYNIKVWPSSSGREPASDSSGGTVLVGKANIQTPVEKPGLYYALVEGLNDHQATIAKSPVQEINLEPLPAFPAPDFLPKTGILQSSPNGSLILHWTPLEKAQEYRIQLATSDGEPIKTATFHKTSTTLANLLPGTYQVQILAIDQYGRETMKGSVRTLSVPDNSGLSAPKLKKVKVN